ncbi:MAG: hypothetical protein PHQ40_15240 [Anaerolineaceae bacterium]|nr:hypothetical protein [Anaerolineaceae bacterium]
MDEQMGENELEKQLFLIKNQIETIAFSWDNTQFVGDLGESFLESVMNGVFDGRDEVLGFCEAGEGLVGQAEDAQGVEGLFSRFEVLAEVDHAADINTEHSDIVRQAGVTGVTETFEVDALELLGIEAVLEGVAITEWSAPVTYNRDFATATARGAR